MKSTFFLKKMPNRLEPAGDGVSDVKYSLNDLALNPLVGQNLSIRFTGKIECVNCSRPIKKTFGDGYCYPCFQTLAACDLCILKPEICHYRLGTCREPDWAKQNCLIKHVVYLANATGLKVGVTRGFKKFERWADQGALAAIEFAIVPERRVAGMLEVALKEFIQDKSDWRALIKGEEKQVDLLAERASLDSRIPEEFRAHLALAAEFSQVHLLRYPVIEYPTKALTYSLEKEPLISGRLSGIRGQYLFISGKAFNARKHSGYEIELDI